MSKETNGIFNKFSFKSFAYLNNNFNLMSFPILNILNIKHYLLIVELTTAANGYSMHLNLTLKTNLVLPSSRIIENITQYAASHDHNVTVLHSSEMSDSSCAYRGNVMNRTNSSVAVTTCRGVLVSWLVDKLVDWLVGSLLS